MCSKLANVTMPLVSLDIRNSETVAPMGSMSPAGVGAMSARGAYAHCLDQCWPYLLISPQLFCLECLFVSTCLILYELQYFLILAGIGCSFVMLAMSVSVHVIHD